MTRKAGSACGISENFSCLLNETVLSVNKQFGYLTIVKYLATKSANAFSKLGLEDELTWRQRNRIFVYDQYFSILNEGTEPL